MRLRVLNDKVAKIALHTSCSTHRVAFYYIYIKPGAHAYDRAQHIRICRVVKSLNLCFMRCCFVVVNARAPPHCRTSRAVVVSVAFSPWRSPIPQCKSVCLFRNILSPPATTPYAAAVVHINGMCSESTLTRRHHHTDHLSSFRSGLFRVGLAPSEQN